MLVTYFGFKKDAQYHTSTKFVIVFLLALFTFSNLNAQDDYKSITRLLAKSKAIEQKDIDRSFLYANQAVEIAKSIKNDTLLSKSHLQQSRLYMFKKEFTKSDSILQHILSQKLPEYIRGLALHNLGTIQYYKQNLKEALTLYLEASETLEKTNKTNKLVSIYSNIGAINATLKNYKNAQIYFERALALSDFDDHLKLQVLVNLSSVYYNQKLFKKYTESIFEAEAFALKTNSTKILSTIYTNLCLYYTAEGEDYDLAITYGLKAIDLKRELNSVNTLSGAYNNLGSAYLEKREYSQAIQYLDSAAIDAETILKPYIYNGLKEAYLGLNDYEIALRYADLKDKIKDSIARKQQKENVAELTEKYESEKKAQRIDILDSQNKIQALTIKQQNYLLITLAIFVLLISVLGYFGFKNYKIQQQLDSVLLQQRLKKTQLNPHFLFNALQSIQNFIHQNDKEKSSTYLTSYSKLIRLVLEKSDEDFITVEDDKIALESYLNLQLLNYNNTFTFNIKVDESVDEDFDLLPTLITQPFVENAILHGLKDNSRGHINVEYYKKQSVLYVSITDNGKGFETKKEDSKRLHKSMSMAIIKEQLQNLNKTSKDFKGAITTNSTPNGTEVILSFSTL
ncbi:tetratricopeptide repeat-containing sensor histidine kinase [Winogradskyella vidalii]|uniref:tetratricopeptide repeat-containing sensor histidine kinase n=1 Tax=Winogradskyella vidalii TaxID=2615024 RepID=UPI0015CACB0C|nr:tetratricopeptide repeat protein [Winogradskyella vidalii]